LADRLLAVDDLGNRITLSAANREAKRWRSWREHGKAEPGVC